MPDVVRISKQNAAMFRDNLLRLQIICNSLRAYAADDATPIGASSEAKTFRQFLAKEFPVIMKQNEKILKQAIRARGDSGGATNAALGLLREDHERLETLVARVCDRLRASSRSRVANGRGELRHEISAFLAAQRAYMSWSRKTVDEAEARAPARD